MGKKRIKLGLEQLGVESDHCHSLAMLLGQDTQLVFEPGLLTGGIIIVPTL